MPLLTLPLELVHITLNNIRDHANDLCALSLTCRALHDLASPLLYSNVDISKSNTARASRFFCFAETMQDNPHLAGLVKAYSGPLYPDSILHTFKPFTRWFQHIVNLKNLSTILPPNRHDVILPECPFRLESLRLDCPFSTFTIESFLKSQPDLISLSISDFRPVGSLVVSPLACPKITALRGNIYTAVIFFPGRHVVRFEWDYGYQESIIIPAELLTKISEQLGKLRSLSYRKASIGLSTHSMFEGPLNRPSVYLQSLRFLEIQVMQLEDWIYIPTLPNLRVLLIAETSPEEALVLNQPIRLIGLFSKCGTLQHIDVAGQLYGATDTCFRWLRGEDKPVSIPLAVAENGRNEFWEDK
ncbi:hypothetical protein GALMADRAFT_157280 [Galerina marginata CBS 339.88]|uniref:F-box domain-containing protein n=1 Tax=Galerina marginata (strain CBS 339.88) TaxID=685588 RepID=A0A067T6H8_GALM3|nr:hypothetical protein GALMADRAFT_157280 [Galerina marginata CBS 339.88]